MGDYHATRPVQVLWLQTSVLVEHIPGRKATPRMVRAGGRMKRATARGDSEALNVARVDYLAETLCGWSLTPGKPTREALSRMPPGWVVAVIKALAADAAEFLKEHDDR